MPKASTPSFVLTLPLAAGPKESRIMTARLEAGKRVRNATLADTLKLLKRMRSSVEWQAANGYVLKSDADQALVAAIESVRQNTPFVITSVSDLVLGNHLKGGETAGEAITPRERQIVRLIAEAKAARRPPEHLASASRPWKCIGPT